MSVQQEQFEMRLAHVGIDGATPEEAAACAREIAKLMGVSVMETPVSYFAGSEVEVMKAPGRAVHGHLGFWVNNINAAQAWFEEEGYAFALESRATWPSGATKLVYFARPIGGFAIHLVGDDVPSATE
jgi:2-dehydro-3-deoxyphosphogluconate aldolase/(4S)-4-hydroxy-2-oxoglutarate aldolase